MFDLVGRKGEDPISWAVGEDRKCVIVNRRMQLPPILCVVLAIASLTKGEISNNGPPNKSETTGQPRHQRAEIGDPAASEWYREVPTLDIYTSLMDMQRMKGSGGSAPPPSSGEAPSLERPWWVEAQERLGMPTLD